MAQRFSVILLFAFIGSHTAVAQPVVLNVKLDNIDNNRPVFLYSQYGPGSVKIDSTTSRNGRFTFEYPDGLPRGFYKIGISENKTIRLILGKESFSIEGDLNQPLSVSHGSSVENTLFQEFAGFNRRLQASNKEIIQKAQQLRNSGGNQQELINLQGQLDALKQEQTALYQKIADENPDLFIGKIIKTFIPRPDLKKETFFSSEELSDLAFTRGDMLLGKIYQYYRNFVKGGVEDWLAAADHLVEKTKAGSAHREVVYLSLVNLFIKGAPDNLWDVLDKYGREYPGSQHYTKLVSMLPPPALRVGDQAPDIVLPDPHGAMQKLSALKGNYVLVDFWASWCGPCRRENPNVVRAYHKFKEYGFKVLGVSLDQNKEKWLAAIEKDQLEWGHISDLRGWKNKGAITYQVTSIPASFLVDPQGIIIAKDLRGPVLNATLEKLLINASKN